MDSSPSTSSVTHISVRTGVRPSTDEAPSTCWCGQPVDLVRGRHCPRCGTARTARIEGHLSRLAA